MAGKRKRASPSTTPRKRPRKLPSDNSLDGVIDIDIAEDSSSKPEGHLEGNCRALVVVPDPVPNAVPAPTKDSAAVTSHKKVHTQKEEDLSLAENAGILDLYESMFGTIQTKRNTNGRWPLATIVRAPREVLLASEKASDDGEDGEGGGSKRGVPGGGALEGSEVSERSRSDDGDDWLVKDECAQPWFVRGRPPYDEANSVVSGIVHAVWADLLAAADDHHQPALEAYVQAILTQQLHHTLETSLGVMFDARSRAARKRVGDEEAVFEGFRLAANVGRTKDSVLKSAVKRARKRLKTLRKRRDKEVEHGTKRKSRE